MNTFSVSFEVWKTCLRDDCQLHGKMQEFHHLDDSVLRIIWEAGTEPSVQGLIDGGPKAA
jgi:hypothetical protein